MAAENCPMGLQKIDDILPFCAVNQFALQLGFDSIGNSRIGRKEILNTTNNGAGSHFSFKKENFQK